MTLADALWAGAIKHPSKAAVIAEHQTFSFQQWIAACDRLGGWLHQQGLQRGSRLAIFAASSTDVLLTVCSCFRSGIVAVPINPQYLAHEAAALLQSVQANALIADEEHWQRLQQIRLPDVVLLAGSSTWHSILTADMPAPPSPDENDVALLMHTSGTTGQPKGVAHRHRAIAANLQALHRLWLWTADDMVLHTLPLHHIHGLLVSATGSLLAGSTLLFQPCFDAAHVLHTLAAMPVTMFMGVPTMYYRMLRQDGPSQFRAMRLFISGSAALPQNIRQGFRQRFGYEPMERAGMTEALMIFSPDVRCRQVPGSVGKPLPGIEVRLVDEHGKDTPADATGEIWIKSPYMFDGYWINPQASNEVFCQGWFRTGDLGRRDAEGNYYLVGRLKDVIKSGGMLIFPGEIESVIATLPGVTDCAVVGIPDEEFGERVKACVVTNRPMTAQDVVEHCRLHLASYKKPSVVAFYAELPRNAMGKVDRQALRNA